MKMPKGGPTISDFAHGMQTLPAMVGVIVAVVAGVWAALIGAWLGTPTIGAVLIGAAGFVVVTLALWALARRNFMRFVAEATPAFPSEPV
jgi:membrane protein YdbS with pleckstrin-like domain